MKNFEKYKDAQERLCAALDWCRRNNRKANVVNAMMWLDLEAEEENPLHCPFCDHIATLGSCRIDPDGVYVTCTWCGYRSMAYKTNEDAIAAHNRVAKAVMDAKAKEEEK